MRRYAAVRRASALTAAAAVIACVATARPLTAQRADSARVGLRPAGPDSATQLPRDSIRPPISPRRAFLYSFLIPGYGQSVLDRPLAGAFFATVELTSIAMARKAAYDLRYAKAHQTDSIVATYQPDPETGEPIPATYVRNRYAGNRVAARKKHLEDYYALLVANHLLAGAEAFVAAQLWDLPARVSIRALPFGPAIAATIRW